MLFKTYGYIVSEWCHSFDNSLNWLLDNAASSDLRSGLEAGALYEDSPTYYVSLSGWLVHTIALCIEVLNSCRLYVLLSLGPLNFSCNRGCLIIFRESNTSFSWCLCRLIHSGSDICSNTQKAGWVTLPYRFQPWYSVFEDSFARILKCLQLHPSYGVRVPSGVHHFLLDDRI